MPNAKLCFFKIVFQIKFGLVVLYAPNLIAATSACATIKNGFPTCAIIHNTPSTIPQSIPQTIMLGVNQFGNLNTPDKAGTAETNTINQNMDSGGNILRSVNSGSVGISYYWPAGVRRPTTTNKTYKAGWYDSTSQGSKWESWAAGAYKDSNGLQAWASVSQEIGNGGGTTKTTMELKSFTVDSTSVKSTVWIKDTSGNPMLEITHLYGPTSGKTNDTLFQGLVTITNISGGTLIDVRYRRNMDWDIIENTSKVEVDAVNISDSYNGSFYPKIAKFNYAANPVTKVVGYCDNGGEDDKHANPFKDCEGDTSALNNNFSTTHGQIGSSFNFQFGDLKCNESATFYVYYGAAESKDKLSKAMQDVGVNMYSMGYDDNFDTLAYAFGFKGVSGTAVAPALPTKIASLPGGSSTNPNAFQTYAPPVVTDGKIYQALFKYQKDKQWIGEIKRYNLDSNGSITNDSPLFASDKLKIRASVKDSYDYDKGGRSIWTVGYDPRCMSYPGLTNGNTNNLSTINKSYLEKLFFNCPKDSKVSETEDLIYFVRGLNSYKEDPVDSTSVRELSVLGDTYHSELVVVNAPNAPWNSGSDFEKSEAKFRSDHRYQDFADGQSSKRRTYIYVGANDGMLHAFDLDLNERWAFIPPPVLPLLRNMAGDKGNFTSDGGGKSNSIFTVDGPITVKDVYVNSTWKTVLIGGLGWGGNAYYALDITNPELPTHLFSFSNDVSNKEINYWDAGGKKSTFPYNENCKVFNYSKLGGAWSRPVIMLLPYKDDSNLDDIKLQRWVAVFGGGYAGGASVTATGTTSSFGAYAYAIDLEPTGVSTKICGATDLTAVNSTGGHVLEYKNLLPDTLSNIPNGVTAHMSVVTGDGTKLANFYGGKAYFTDLHGQLWKWNLSKNDLDKDPNSVLFTTEKLFKSEGTLENDRMGYNQLGTTIVTQQVGGKSVNRLFNYFGTGDLTRIQRRVSTINNRIYGISDDSFLNTDISGNTLTVDNTNFDRLPDVEGCSNTKSWYANVSPSSEYKPSANFQKIVGRAAVFNKYIYFTAYEPEKEDCPIYGQSKLIEVSNTCQTSGSGAIVGEGLATQPVIDNKGNIYIGIGNLPQDKTLQNGVDNIARLKATPIANTGRVQYKSWREKRAY